MTDTCDPLKMFSFSVMQPSLCFSSLCFFKCPIKWDHFEILAKGRSDTHCKIKETLLIQELKPTLNDNVSSEKLYLY